MKRQFDENVVDWISPSCLFTFSSFITTITTSIDSMTRLIAACGVRSICSSMWAVFSQTTQLHRLRLTQVNRSEIDSILDFTILFTDFKRTFDVVYEEIDILNIE